MFIIRQLCKSKFLVICGKTRSSLNKSYLSADIYTYTDQNSITKALDCQKYLINVRIFKDISFEFHNEIEIFL